MPDGLTDGEKARWMKRHPEKVNKVRKRLNIPSIGDLLQEKYPDGIPWKELPWATWGLPEEERKHILHDKKRKKQTTLDHFFKER